MHIFLYPCPYPKLFGAGTINILFISNTFDIGYITDINANISNDINIIRQENNIKISFSKKKKLSFF